MEYFAEHLLPEERSLFTYVPTTAQYIDLITERYADKPALSDETRTETYAEMADHIARRRTVLKEQGLKLGDMVGLLDVNSIAAVEWFLALTSYGCTAVMMPAQLSPEVVAGSALRFEMKCIIAGPALIGNTAKSPVPVIPAETMAETATPAGAVEKTTRCAVFFTGGTTGTPKGVVLNHGAFMRGTYNGAHREGTVLNQTLVAVLPFTHVFGLIFSLTGALFTGAQVAVCGVMRNVFAMMAQYKPTTMVVVPGLGEMMLGMVRMRGIGVLGGNLKTVIMGGAPVPPKTIQGFIDLGISVAFGYGMTETANLVAGNFDFAKYPTSVGQHFPEQEVKVVDGELWVRGDLLFDGYWKDEAATAAAMEDGWLKTGDLARIDENGYIYIVGRIKNLIILGNGENVSPEEVEEVFYRSPMIHDCLVSEMEVNGTAVIGMEVQPMPGVTEEAVRAEVSRLNKTLPSTMQVSKVIVRMEDFKKTGSLKIARNQH